MKKMKKISLLALLALNMLGTNAYALEEWPVADAAIRKAMSGLSTQFETARAADTEMAKLQENNTTAANISNTTLNIMSDMRTVIRNSAPDLNKCIIETRRMAGGGAVGKSSTVTQMLTNEFHASSSTTGAANRNSAQGRVENKTCTELDVQNNISGCTADKIDPIYSGSSEDATVLFLNRENKEGITIANDQIAIAKQYIEQLDDWLPQSSTAGRNNAEYTRQINLLKQDMSVVKANMSRVLAEHIPLPVNPQSAEGLTWFNSSNQNEYKGWFNIAMPEKPSLMDKLRTSVWQDAYGSKMAANLAGDELMQLRTQNEILAKQNVILYKMLEQQEAMLLSLSTMNSQLSRISYALNDPSKVGASGR